MRSALCSEIVLFRPPAGRLLVVTSPTSGRTTTARDRCESPRGIDPDGLNAMLVSGVGLVAPILEKMSDVTQILSEIEHGDPQAAGRLLPLVYAELRQLAARKMAHEAAGHTLQATALVHEAYLRLVGDADEASWDSRGHFFAAAAEAMRRILIENARRKGSLKRGGKLVRRELDDPEAASGFADAASLLDLDAALTKLAAEDPGAARLVELRYFAGLTIDEAAHVLGVSPRTAKRQWAYARAWLGREIESE